MIDHTQENLPPVIKVDRTKEIRCTNTIQSGRLQGKICNKRFAIGDIGRGGAIEHMCPRCKQLSRIAKLS